MSKPGVKLEDLPHRLNLSHIAAFLGVSRWWVAHRVDEDRCVVVMGGGKELPVWREGRRWYAWRADLADTMGENTRRQTDEGTRPQTPS